MTRSTTSPKTETRDADQPLFVSKVSPTDRRINAVCALMDKALRASYLTFEGADCGDRDYWAQEIAGLRILGRTDRWVKAIDTWADMVGNDEYPLDWVFLQYGIFAGYAA